VSSVKRRSLEFRECASQPKAHRLRAQWFRSGGYALSYRELEEMMNERGLSLDHTKIYRWVKRYAPELEKRCRPHLRPSNDSYRVDETYVKIKGKWYYLYRFDSWRASSRLPPEPKFRSAFLCLRLFFATQPALL
jgi:hypothetical protein